MIFISPTRVRLTRSEQDYLRLAAARNGVAVPRIETPAQLLDAVLAGLSPDRQQDLLSLLANDVRPNVPRPASNNSSREVS